MVTSYEQKQTLWLSRTNILAMDTQRPSRLPLTKVYLWKFPAIKRLVDNFGPGPSSVFVPKFRSST